MGAPRLRQDLLAFEVVPRPEVGLGRDGSEGVALERHSRERDTGRPRCCVLLRRCGQRSDSSSCTGLAPDRVIMLRSLALGDGNLAAYPGTGVYTSGGWDRKDAQTPKAFADSRAQWAAQWARIVGGCCGYGPEHIRVMSTRLAGARCDAPS